MLLATTENIAGKEYEVLGLVKGSTIQSKHLGKDFLSGLKTMVGGEIKAYTEMMNDSRKIATDRMVQEAQGLGADAIVALRYSTSAIIQGSAEVMAYGTAVRFK